MPTTLPMPGRHSGPAAAAVSAYRDALARLVAAPPAAELASQHAAAMDEMVSALAREAAGTADPGKTWAVIALGGYGAGRLLPYSDVDLLVTSSARSDRIRPFVSALLYPIWDAGLKVGHAVRDRKEAVAAAAEDPANLTAMLTGRLVAGDPELAAKLLGAVARQAAHKPLGKRGLFTLMAARERPGSPWELWPDLKEVRGGQRDLDELVWSAAGVSSGPSAGFEPLVDAGLLSLSQAELLDRAQSDLTVARWVAHVVHGRGDNRYDEDVEPHLPFDPEKLQASLADVEGALSSVRSCIRALNERPSARAAASKTPTTPADVLSLLVEGPARLEEVEEAAWRGALDPAIPGWRDLMVLRRPALSHRLTVGAHSLAAASMVTDVLAADPRAAAALSSDEDRDVLLVAAIVHDMGKRLPGSDHAVAGAAQAHEAALALGLHERQALRVAELVRHHLVLASTAGNDDIDDEDVVLGVAAAIGDPATARALYVLTEVDSLATGPEVWTPWKAALVGELAGKVERVLSGGGSTEASTKAAAIRARVVELAWFEPMGQSVADFARQAPSRYLAEHTPEEVIEHAKLAFTLSQGGRRTSASVEVRAGSHAGAWTVTIVAMDRPGLLALLAGVVALSGLDILGVSAHTTSRGSAVDTFTVKSASLAAIEPSTWATLERLLYAALAGKLAVPTRLAERRQHYRSAERYVDPRVNTSTKSDFTTSFTVKAGDRVGLMHDLAQALADHGLDIRSVTALTTGGLARDTFRVLDQYGRPPRDPELLESARGALISAAVGNPTSTDDHPGRN